METAKFMGHGVCDNIAKSATLATTTSSASIICRYVDMRHNFKGYVEEQYSMYVIYVSLNNQQSAH